MKPDGAVVVIKFGTAGKMCGAVWTAKCVDIVMVGSSGTNNEQLYSQGSRSFTWLHEASKYRQQVSMAARRRKMFGLAIVHADLRSRSVTCQGS